MPTYTAKTMQLGKTYDKRVAARPYSATRRAEMPRCRARCDEHRRWDRLRGGGLADRKGSQFFGFSVPISITRYMDDVVAFPEPAWLAAYSEATLSAIVAQLSDEAQQLYRQYLADEARAPSPPGMHPACRAFSRMDREMMRHNSHRRAGR